MLPDQTGDAQPGLRQKVAIVGAGVSGLTAAYLIAPHHDVTLFEREDRAGGHAHTHEIVVDGRELSVDSGFLVYNHRTYPGFIDLLERLGVDGAPSDMSFGIWCRRCRLAYSSRGARGFLARPGQALRPRHWQMALDIRRFNREGKGFLTSDAPDSSIAEFLNRHGPFGSAVVGHYLLPMVGAIWSASGRDVLDFSARALLRFLENHGLLAFDEAPPWWTIPRGSRRYVDAITAILGDRVRLGTPVESIRREPDRLLLRSGGDWQPFDAVVLAVHADIALRILEDADDGESRILGGFRYSENRTLLHTDRSVLPPWRDAWASWNSDLLDCQDHASPAKVTYHLNRLQSLPGPTDVCVSLNREVREDRVLAEMVYHHPIMDADAYRAQPQLQALSGQRRTFFAGAHLGAGFHEDGVRSARAVASLFGGEP